MELRVFDKTVQPLGAIDELASLLWHTKYFDVGTFSLLAPITDNNSRLLVEGNLITKHDEKKEVKTADGGVWRRAAQITYVHITKDENGLEQLEAQGYMLSWWLNKRCIYPQIVATGTNQYLINLTEIAGVYDSYVSKTEGLFAQYESQFNERYSSFESTLDNWDKELLSAYTEFMAKIKLFQSDAENEFNTWFESIKDKLGEDIAGSLQLQIEELAAAMQEVKKQAEAGTKETKEAIAALDERLKRVESGWGIDYKHDAVLGLCYMGAAYMSQHYERTVETAVLGATYVGNSYLANTF